MPPFPPKTTLFAAAQLQLGRGRAILDPRRDNLYGYTAPTRPRLSKAFRQLRQARIPPWPLRILVPPRQDNNCALYWRRRLPTQKLQHGGSMGGGVAAGCRPNRTWEPKIDIPVDNGRTTDYQVFV